MPLIQVKVLEGVFSIEQKEELVRKVTDAIVSIEGESFRPVTCVVLEDVVSGQWAMGQAISRSQMKPMTGGG